LFAAGFFCGSQLSIRRRAGRFGAISEGGIAYREFATDPCSGLLGRLKALFFPPKLIDNGNVSVQALDGKIVALTETTIPVIFDPETLETQRVFGFDARPDGQVTSAGPHLRCRAAMPVQLCREIRAPQPLSHFPLRD